MARGVRSGATLLSPNLQPQSIASYDPITRRNTILVASIVPTLHLADSIATQYLPADRYYAHLGLPTGITSRPLWVSSGTNNITVQNYDASGKAFYARLSNDASRGIITGLTGAAEASRLFYYGGVGGLATSYAPKNVAVTKMYLQFRARFNTNADYTIYGVGLMYRNAGAASATAGFDSAGSHFIQVLRNTTAWELGTCDGTTISQSSGGTGDGSFHDFKVTWESGTVTLYVDGTSTITKTTNLPTQPLAAHMLAENSTNTIDIVDYLVSWE